MLEWILYDYYKREEEDKEVINVINYFLKVDVSEVIAAIPEHNERKPIAFFN